MYKTDNTTFGEIVDCARKERNIKTCIINNKLPTPRTDPRTSRERSRHHTAELQAHIVYDVASTGSQNCFYIYTQVRLVYSTMMRVLFEPESIMTIMVS